MNDKTIIGLMFASMLFGMMLEFAVYLTCEVIREHIRRKTRKQRIEFLKNWCENKEKVNDKNG